MIAAAEPRADRRAQRLMRVDVARGTLTDGRVASLAEHARPGDVWVLNDAATLPASLAGRAGGRSVELRLAGERVDGSWRAVLFGEGSWRDDTDARPPPPVLAPGEAIELGGALDARVIEVDDRSPRLLTVRFEPGGDAFWRALYALGRPVQYSYLGPSAGRPLDAGLLLQLRRRGAEVTSLTHAAGLSATGDADLDARLPLPERYDVPERTADAIRRALAEGRRVVAVGTSVTRALEGAFALHGEVPAGPGETGMVIGQRTPLRVVDALLTGAHDPQSSHYQLLRAFAPDALLARAVERSTAIGYLGHELGDSWLIA